MMPARIFYKSRLFVAGVALLVLGIGNYLAAISKVAHYRHVVAARTPQIPQPQSFFLRGADKAFPGETRERWEIARAKLDYYHIVLSGGQLMMSVGLGCLILALIKLRRQRLRYTLTHGLAGSSSSHGQAPTP